MCCEISLPLLVQLQIDTVGVLKPAMDSNDLCSKIESTVALLCGGVCPLSRCCYAMGKIELHSSVQLADNQSGFLTINRSSSAAGMSVGVGWACGYDDLNNDMLLRDSASAILLC